MRLTAAVPGAAVPEAAASFQGRRLPVAAGISGLDDGPRDGGGFGRRLLVAAGFQSLDGGARGGGGFGSRGRVA